MSDEIFREVDEEVKHERWLALWQQYGWYVVGLTVFVVATTGAIVLWQNIREARQADLSEQFAAASDLAAGGQLDAALASFDAIAEEDGGYAMLARFRQAAILTENGDNEAAVAIYGDLANNDDYDEIYRELAVVLMAMSGLSANSSDAARLDFDALDLALDGVADGEGPFRFSAREIGAALALATGDRDGAADRLKLLTDDPETPLGIRQRAAELLRAVEGS
ncbi:MAG: tetratricopeptide repeat protein [Alphaproteobacteria bacterium]|nr:tetratricopeptide repeat protein [Alphaproteobacteria bacterium]